MPRISWRQLHFHQQEQEYYCGAACAQMLLHSQSVGQPLLSQDQLYNEMHSTGSVFVGVDWAAAPDRLQAILDAHKGGFPRSFRLFQDDHNALDATKRIIRHLDANNVAALALVYGYIHWVVVRGYTLSQANPPMPLTLDIYNPYPPVPGYLADPPPHIDIGEESDGDGCGTGDDRGYVLNNLSYLAWKQDYMTGWDGVFITICDPSEDDPDYPVNGEVDKAPPAGESRDDGVREEAAPQRALVGLRQAGMLDDEEWGPLVAKTHPGKVHAVERRAPGAVPYYIVEFEADDGSSAPLAVRIDARTGAYLEAAGVPNKPKAQVVKILDEETVRNRLRQDEYLHLSEEDLARATLALFWEPCIESLSPFHPLYEMTIPAPPDGRARTLYVRASDAATFTQLSTERSGPNLGV